MDITPYVESLRRDLVTIAGDDERTKRLARGLDSAARLALMEAISRAAAEITAELPDGEVEVRLEGRRLAFVVQAAAPTPAPPETEDIGTARITLRLPESLKTRAEGAAAALGQSLTTWLVGAVRRAAAHSAEPDVDLVSRPLSPHEPNTGRGPHRLSASS